MGLKLLISTMVFSGLFKCITLPTFQMFGIFALFTEKFMCEWDISVLWGLNGVSGLALFYLGSAPHFSFCLLYLFSLCYTYTICSVSSFFIAIRVFYLFFFWLCGVYCWLNLLAHLLGSLWRLVFWAPNYFALFAGCLSSIDKKSFRCAQSLDQLLLWVSVCTSLIQFLHLCPWTLFFTSRFSCYFWWPWRFFLNFISFSENFTASLGKFATTFYLFLVRYDCQPLRYGFR